MLSRILSRLTELSYTLLRTGAGLMFCFHGLQKIFGVLATSQPAVGTQIWFGGIIELVGGLAIALGLFTSWAAFLCSGTMAVAYVQFHWKLQLDTKFLPSENNGELALLYSLVFFFIACRGSGAFSLDRRRA